MGPVLPFVLFWGSLLTSSTPLQEPGCPARVFDEKLSSHPIFLLPTTQTFLFLFPGEHWLCVVKEQQGTGLCDRCGGRECAFLERAQLVTLKGPLLVVGGARPLRASLGVDKLGTLLRAGPRRESDLGPVM